MYNDEERANYDEDQEMSLNPFWICEKCGAQNSKLDGDCQYCEPEEEE